MRVYHAQTSPLIGFYMELSENKSKNPLKYLRINGLGDIDEIQKSIISGLKG